MLQIGGYLKLILIKKGISQGELARMLNKQNIGPFIGKDKNSKSEITKFKVSGWIIGTEALSLAMSRRIEIALNLPKNELMRFVKNQNFTIDKKNLEKVENWYKEECLKEKRI